MSEAALDFDQHVVEAITSCFQCGACTAACPLNLFNGVRLNPRRMLRNLQLGYPYSIDPYACMMCLACESVCPRGVRVTDVMNRVRRRLFQENKAPQRLIQAVWDVYELGNPWGYPARDRGKWLTGLQVDGLKQRAETLLYVGCISSYDIRLQKVAQSLVKLLSRAGVSFTVLGDEERCCGDSVMNAGETDFLEELIHDNIKSFKERGVKTVVTLSPHCYRMIKDIYPRYGSDVEALHYTEYLARLVDQNILRFDGELKLAVTYHDPCYLGRYGKVFEEPRKLLESVKGIRLNEMRLSKETAICCGGGGGRIFLESKPEERPSILRVRQAADTGAEILATACPYCIINFEDAVKLQKARLKVADVAELIATAVV